MEVPIDAEQPTGEEPRPAKVTIRDVALAAGVSASTVCRALARPGRVNLETAKHVREVAERLGYQTKDLEPDDERVLRGAILAITADLRYPIFGEYIYGMQQQCEERDFCLLTAVSSDDPIKERATIRRMIPAVDGIILAASRLSNASIRKAAQVRPLVTINRPVGGVQSVVSDDRQSIGEIVATLKGLGHTSITYLAGHEASWHNGLRWQALLVACQQHSIRARQIPCGEVLLDPNSVAVFEPFLKNPSTAVVAFNDGLAIRFIDYLRLHGIGVPEQVSVVGADDTAEGQTFTPPLSSIFMPREEMGRIAADKS